LVLEQAAQAGNATAALELGATYDPAVLQKWRAPTASRVQGVSAYAPTPAPEATVADIAMARTWYEKARDLGSTEAAERLKALTTVD
jgi:TPR repeat protein